MNQCHNKFIRSQSLMSRCNWNNMVRMILMFFLRVASVSQWRLQWVPFVQQQIVQARWFPQNAPRENPQISQIHDAPAVVASARVTTTAW